MISIEDALKTILNHISPLKSVNTPITDCRGRVLNKDIKAFSELPPFSNSAMDGYAVRAADTKGASPDRPRLFIVQEDLPAGQIARHQIAPGQASRIMTGAPLPRGADAVVIVEVTREEKRKKVQERKVAIFKEVKRGENIRLAGESVKKGAVVLKKGKVLRPPEIGMLAALGFSKVAIIPPPRVAIISTGNELQEIHHQPRPGKIRDCNRYSLIALVQQYGGIPVPLGIARDRETDLRTKFKEALFCDMILVSGGVSVGIYDLVKKVLSDMSAEIKIWQVAMKPGKPLAFGVIRRKPVFGLPGNPVSVVVSFLQFVRPALLTMEGKTKLRKPEVETVLTEDCNEKTSRTHLVRATLTKKNGIYYARLTGPQGSGILYSLVLGNALLVIPPNRGPLKKGEKVRAILLDEKEVE